MTQNFANRTLRGRPFKLGDDLRGANFQGAILRGVNFKNLNLSRADFSSADICGANFTNAILTETNFRGAKAGLQKICILSQVIIVFILSIFLNISSSLLISLIVSSLFDSRITERYTLLPGIIIFITLGIICFIVARLGLTSKSISIISIFISVTISIVFAVSFIFTLGVSGIDLVAISFAGISTLAVAFALTSALFFIIIFAIIFSVLSVLSGRILSLFAFVVALGVVFTARGNVMFTAVAGNTVVKIFPDTDVVLIFVLLVFVFLGAYIAWRALIDDEKFKLVRDFSIVVGAIGGTSFCGANLTLADFTGAILKNTNFTNSKSRQTCFKHVCWENSKLLEHSRLGSSILLDSTVRELLVTRNGDGQNLFNANLSGANLSRVNLERANLTRADLSSALLHEVHLEDTHLREANVLGADLTGAYLTGACIEAWNIDASTILENVDCQHIFLLEQPIQNGNRERRPSSGNFAPGEFTKLFQEVLSTIDLIFQDGIDWKAFVTAFKTLQVQNQDTELTIQSIENKGDGVVVVRVNAPPDANKEKIHSEFSQNYDDALKALEAKYQAELRAKDREITIYRKQSADMKSIIDLLAQRPVTVEVNANAESKAMNDSTDSSRKIKIDNRGGNFNASGSAFNLGDISGTVTNTLQQLQTANHPNAPQLADLLKQLQTAVNDEPTLSDEEKAEALTEVNVLAEAGKNPQKETQQKKANLALEILKNTIAALTPTAALVKACSELLPAIAKLLGL